MPNPQPQPQPLPDPDGRPGPHDPRPDPIPTRGGCRETLWEIRAWLREMPVSGFMPGVRTVQPQERVNRIFPSSRPMLGDSGYIRTGGRRSAERPW